MQLKTEYVAIVSTLGIIVGSIAPIPNTLRGDAASTVAHILSYTICSFFWTQVQMTKRRYLVFMLVLIPLSEILQLPFPHRNVSLGDVIANLIGTITGYFLSRTIQREK